MALCQIILPMSLRSYSSNFWFASLSMYRHNCFLLSFSNSCVSVPASFPTACLRECSLRSSLTLGNCLVMAVAYSTPLRRGSLSGISFSTKIWQSLLHGRPMGCDVATDVGYGSLTAFCWQIVYKRTCLGLLPSGKLKCCTSSFAVSSSGAASVSEIKCLSSHPAKAHSPVSPSLLAFSMAK